MSAGTICQTCGKPLGEKAVQGLCPECFMKVGLGSESPSAGNAGPRPGAFVAPAIAELAGSFPQLEILGLIGRGGMGAVYQARQKGLDRLVALKVLPDAIGDAAFAERFAREARALAQLNHPNIVAIYDFGQAGGFYYLLMEFVDGVNLRQMFHAQRLSPRESMSIVPQICEALQFAHDHGVVHRDIKPENVLVDKQGRVKIADFGLARLLSKETQSERLTRAAEVMGTPHYMAPEQVERPLEVDHRADIYSLGVVFYEMLTGELPLGRFAAPSRKVQVDVRLDEIVLRALEKEPSLRFQQASHVSSAVATCATQPPAIPAPVRPVRTTSGLRAWLWAGAGFALAIFCLVLFWVGATVLNAARASRMEAAARMQAEQEAQTAATQPTRDPAEGSRLSTEGWQLWQAQRWNEAITKFQESLRFYADDANAWNGLGWAQFNSGRSREAEESFKSAVQLQPSHPGALNGLGQVYLSERKYDEAETNLLRAAPQASAAWYGLARIYLLKGRFAEAEEFAQRIVDSGQADAVATRMLQAAHDKKLSEGLKVTIEPPPNP